MTTADRGDEERLERERKAAELYASQTKKYEPATPSTALVPVTSEPPEVFTKPDDPDANKNRHFHVEVMDDMYPHAFMDIAFASFNDAADFERACINKQYERGHARNTHVTETRNGNAVSLSFDDGSGSETNIEISHCFGQFCLIRNEPLILPAAED